jgi:CDP-glucose 4,6-dehydratase
MDFWKHRRVFVTGGTGLVGSWLVKALLKKKADVVVLVRDWVPSSILLSENLQKKFTVVRGDLSDSNFLKRVLNEYEIKSVFHLAAQTIVPIANKNPLSTFESNIQGTWNLLEACRVVKSADSIIIASSDKAYGDVSTLPYKEDMPLNAVFPYDVSKACKDMIAACYAKSFNLPICVTRCGNFFGGGDLNWNRIIPGSIRAIFNGQPPIIRSDGTLIRDYIYVEDAVDAYLTLSRALSEQPHLRGEVFNFSNKTQKTVLEIIVSLLFIMKSPLTPFIEGNNNGEIKAQYLDSSKAQKLLNWQAQFGLEQGLQETVTWYQNYLKKEDSHDL